MNLVCCQYFYLDDSLNLFLGYLRFIVIQFLLFRFLFYYCCISIVAIVKRMQCVQNVRIHNVATFKNFLIFFGCFFCVFFSQWIKKDVKKGKKKRSKSKKKVKKKKLLKKIRKKWQTSAKCTTNAINLWQKSNMLYSLVPTYQHKCTHTHTHSTPCASQLSVQCKWSQLKLLLGNEGQSISQT